jgi:prepilin-type processing-associated H-X9-DG protein
MIEFNCTCGKALQAEDQYAGRLTRCPQCGSEQPIPGRGGAIQSDTPPDQARTRPTDVQQHPDRAYDEPAYPSETRRPPRMSGKAIAALVCGVFSFGFSFLTAIPAIILGLIALSEIGKSQGRLTGKALAVAGMLLSVLSLLCVGPALTYGLYVGVGRVRVAAARTSSANNLKQMALAMHNYHDSNGCLPPAQGPSPQGMAFNPGGGPGGAPKVSWRVLILPYIEEGSLYNQYNFNEPWDGPNNSKLLAMMPKVYKLPGDEMAPPGYTYYQVFVSSSSSQPQALFSTDPNMRVRLTDITDGSSNTLMIVEAATPVPWTKPDDIPFDPNGPVPRLGTHFNGGCNAAMADGSVRFLPGTISSTTLKALITRNGGEMVATDF